ncbi:MAG: hypothetical protein KatS3mg054_0611 [Chloroflexus sp.]|nr:MAG: hypothetical protein KatS3mg054_0611 [Chloroflexus sp.]
MTMEQLSGLFDNDETYDAYNAAETQEQDVSFDDLWLEQLNELGFRFNDYGELEFGTGVQYAPNTQGYDQYDEDGQPQQQQQVQYDPALYKTIVSGMVDRTIQQMGINADPLLKQAVVAFLSAQPPSSLTDVGVRFTLLAALGLRALKEREFEEQRKQVELKKNPKKVLDPNFRQGAENLAAQLGIDPDELIAEYIQEWTRKQGGK